jgi:small subunit ribosomal protein S16
MAVVIRMRRTGRKNLPCFRIIATDSRFPRDGRQLETLGHYDPLRKDPAVGIQLDLERVKHWISVGAVPSPIVWSILRKRGITSVVRKPADRSGRSARDEGRREGRARQGQGRAPVREPQAAARRQEGRRGGGLREEVVDERPPGPAATVILPPDLRGPSLLPSLRTSRENP